MQLLSKLRATTRYWRLLFYFILFSANGWTQSITLSVDRQPLEKVFLLIEKQSGYNFIYSSEAIAQSKPVTVNVKDESLPHVLSLCFKNQPLNYTTTENKHIIVKLKMEEKPVSSDRVLKGKVVNENGEAVAGVTIAIKNSQLVTVSDKNGHFNFTAAPDNVILLVSGAEMESQEVHPGNQPFILINTRAKLGTLDETIVIAYGKTNRRYATGSVSSVKAAEISKQPVSNLLSALTARVPGLQVTQVSGVPGSYIRLQLRGINSIANGNDPLFVIDGIPFPSVPLNGSIGVGASVSSSPLNILNPSDIESVEILKDADATAIFGSRGANGVILITTKKGEQGKTNVSLRFYQGAGKVTRQMNLLNTAEYLMMRKEAFANDNVTPSTSNAPDLVLWDSTGYTDWQKELIGHTMHSTDANVSVSGGTAQTQFLFGVGYHRETTVFPGQFGENRKSANLNLSHQSSDKKFSLSVSSSYSHYNNKLPQQDLYSGIILPPNAPAIYGADGKFNWENSSWSNPIARTKAVFITNTDNVSSNINTGYLLLPGLQFRISAGFNVIFNRDHSMTPTVSKDPAFSPRPTAGFGNKTIQTIIAEPQLEYTSKLGKGDFSILAGSTLQDTRQKALYQSGSGYTSDDLLESIKSASQIITLSETDIRYRYAGLFGRIKYDWSKKYLLSLTMRRDGSSRYGEDNRFSNFGSVGAAWIFTNESFIKNWKALSFGKLKGSAGTTGNDQIGDYKYLDLYAPFYYSYLGTTPFIPEQLHNPEYGWEKVTKLEAGLDLGFFNNRILAAVNYYHNTTTNQLVNYPLPGVSGFTGILRNIPAKIRNTGWEIELNTINIKSKKFNWTTLFNITIPTNKLLSFENLESSSYASQYVIGEPLSIVKKYHWQGVDPASGNHTFRDYNQDGQISITDDQQEIIFTGSQFYGGLQNNLTLGNWSLSFLLQFTARKYGNNYLSVFSRPGLLMNQPVLVLDRWQKPGDITSVQRYAVSNPLSNPAFSAYRQSDAAYSNTSFVRLRNLMLSYDLVGKKWKSRGLNQCSIFIQGHNLVTITGYDGLDPENLTQLVPPVRMITAGFQLTF